MIFQNNLNTISKNFFSLFIFKMIISQIFIFKMIISQIFIFKMIIL